MSQSSEGTDGFQWYSPMEPPFVLSGFPWFESDKVYRRLPLHPSHPLPPAVDALANCTAGGQIRFRTDARQIALRARLANPGTMYHMPATGQCGFDCYIGPAGAQRYLSTARFEPAQIEYETMLLDLQNREVRNITINFPLYQGVQEVYVGLDLYGSLQPPDPWSYPGRIIAYGTSITQGGCASRPGLAYTNILSRRLNVEFVNLGFSGNGKGEPELAHLMTQIHHPLCFVLDYEANAGEGIRTTLEPFIQILRSVHPETPIVVVSRVLPSMFLFDDSTRASITNRRQFQRETVEQLSREGMRRLYFLDGAELMGEDFDECTVDGAHPTDLGFLRMADRLEPVLRQVLTETKIRM